MYHKTNTNSRIGAVLLTAAMLISMAGGIYAADRPETNREALLELSETFSERLQARRTQQYYDLLTSDDPLQKQLNEDPNIELMYIHELGYPVYYSVSNLNAAKTISTDDVWPGGTTGLSLSGAGTGFGRLGIWDGGGVLETHQEFGGRVRHPNGPISTHPHSTHVAGTMIAAGVQAAAKGMSYAARLDAYDWTNDNGEMAAAAAAGMNVSNHSYGNATGWSQSGSTWYWWGDVVVSQTEDCNFGYYSDEAQAWDQIAANAPFYTICKAAGNDRNDAGPGPGGNHAVQIGGIWQWSTVTRDPDGGANGYDCLPPKGTAKNIITVGAVNDIPGGYSTPGGVVMTSFSGWGPTDDGRIKPDLVANGRSVYSCDDASNTAYDNHDGTSMATPNLSGSLNLLVRQYESTHSGVTPLSSTMKAVLINTADEAGPNPGPDYMFGWGLANIRKAAELIDADGSGSDLIHEESLTNGQTDQFQIVSNGVDPIRLSIVWTDPAGTPHLMNDPSDLNRGDLKLVNDLDMRLEHVATSTVSRPYVLNPNVPAAAATTGDNFRDNVEQIYLAAPSAGTYLVSVTHKGTLASAQSYSLVSSVPFGGATTDCNGNGVDDATDIANGTSTDFNNNGIPDECEAMAVCPPDFDWAWMIRTGDPGTRWGHAMAYDRLNGRTIMFGGLNSDQTWEWTGGWNQLSPIGSPSGRTRAEMVYDIDHGVIVLFGGQNSTTFFGDTWVFNVRTDTWTQAAVGSSPSARVEHSMSYDSERGVIVLFGGDNPNYVNLGDTWEGVYDPVSNDVTWMLVSTSGPAARSSHAMTYDPIHKVTVLYGGLPGSTETWAYDGTSWSQLSTVDDPGSRNGHAMTFHETLGEILVYGGNSSSNTGLWGYDWDNSTWVEIAAGDPGTRSELAMVYHAIYRQLVIFGGTGGNAATWYYPCASRTMTFALSGTANGTGWSYGVTGVNYTFMDLTVPGVPVGGTMSDFVERFVESIESAGCPGLVAAPVRGTDNCFTITACQFQPFIFRTGSFGQPPMDVTPPWSINPTMDEIELAGTDCNTNGVDDAIDIFLGTSQDSDGNGVPDECEMEPDCSTLTGDININGLPWEIADAVQLTNAILYHDIDLLPCVGNADINGDCRVDVDDLVHICRIVAGDSAQTDYAGLCFQYEVCLDTSGVCTSCCRLRGDIDHNGIGPDIADLVYLVNYMFGGGEEPPCMEEADVDGNGQGPDIADLVYLINYMFGGGPAPVPCGEGVPWSKLSSVSDDVVIDRTYADGVTTIALSSEIDLAGIELELAGNQDAAPTKQLGSEFEMYYHCQNGHMKIGLLDMQGEFILSAGEIELVTIPGRWDMVSALVADQYATAIRPGMAKGNPAVPAQFSLAQNYPNPFNPSTEISFEIPVASSVTLEVYNIMGQRVTTLVDDNLEAGQHSVTWDAGRHSSGVYFYRLDAGSFVSTKKMVLMK
ncbi:MAG: S8 family serine peptidase [bacterium]